MEVKETGIPGLLVVKPSVFGDERGYFFEGWNSKHFSAQGIDEEFVQDNFSLSSRGVLRGLHFQRIRPQGKLVKVLQGEVFDVAVDIRRGSPTWGRWYGIVLSESGHEMMWIPRGFAHGFCVLSEKARFWYKCTDYYCTEGEDGILWSDPDIGVAWPLEEPPYLSPRDGRLGSFHDLDSPFTFGENS